MKNLLTQLHLGFRKASILFFGVILIGWGYELNSNTTMYAGICYYLIWLLHTLANGKDI
jgi:hypothetical protein